MSTESELERLADHIETAWSIQVSFGAAGRPLSVEETRMIVDALRSRAESAPSQASAGEQPTVVPECAGPTVEFDRWRHVLRNYGEAVKVSIVIGWLDAAERELREAQVRLAECERDAEHWKRLYECAQNANAYRQDALGT